MKILRTQELNRRLGSSYSSDKRKRRRQHRHAAKALVGAGTFMNPGRAPVGSTLWTVAQWHLANARWLGR